MDRMEWAEGDGQGPELAPGIARALGAAVGAIPASDPQEAEVPPISEKGEFVKGPGGVREHVEAGELLSLWEEDMAVCTDAGEWRLAPGTTWDDVAEFLEWEDS